MTTMEITPQNLSKKKDDFVVCKQRYFLEKGKQSIICLSSKWREFHPPFSRNRA